MQPSLQILFLIQIFLNCLYKAVKCCLSLRISLIYACILEYVHEYFADFLLENIIDIIRIYAVILFRELVYPVSMLLQNLILTKVSATELAISDFNLAGRTARPITSISPIFSFLI